MLPSHTFRLLTATGGLFLLCACAAVGPDYVKPAMEIPPAFSETAGWKVAQPKDSAIGEKWWELFSDPQLNSLEEQVVISNQNIAVAEAQFRQARSLVQASRAGSMPAVTLGPAASRTKRSGSLGNGSGSTTSDFLLPLDLSWEADIWGRIRRTIEASQAGFQASAADLAAVRLSAQAELAGNYFQLQTLDSQKQLLDETITNYQKSLDLTKNRYEAGVVAKVDVLLAETQLKSATAQSVDLGVQRAQLEHAIALLMGKPAGAVSIPVSPQTTGIPAIPAGLPSELLERRPDIAMAERQVAAANAQIGASEAAYYPTLRFSAGAGLEAIHLSKLLSWPSRFWSVGPTVSQTLYDGGLRKAQNEGVRAAHDATVASYRQTVLTAFREVEDNLAAIRILEEEARVQEEAVAAALQTVAAAANQYKAGVVSYLNVIVAQNAELSNRSTANAILGRRMAAAVQLIKSLGGGWTGKTLLDGNGSK